MLPDKRSRRRGFSLVELMVVISIIGLMSAIVTVNLVKRRVWASQQKVRADVKQLEKVIVIYHGDVGQYPSSLSDLVHSSGAAGWNGPYIDGGDKALVDPWGRPYVYALTGGDEQPYAIGSYGADGVAGGKDADKDIFPATE